MNGITVVQVRVERATMMRDPLVWTHHPWVQRIWMRPPSAGQEAEVEFYVPPDVPDPEQAVRKVLARALIEPLAIRSRDTGPPMGAS